MDCRTQIRPGRALNLTLYDHPHSDTTVFLIHGLGGRSGQWREQIVLLKDKYSLVIPDLLGHGASPKPSASDNYLFCEFEKDLDALFNHYANTNNIVLGHSYGGALATSLTLDHQDLIHKLILISPVPCRPNKILPFVYRLPASMMEWARPWMEKKFQQLAFDAHAQPGLLAEELQAGRSNPMYIIKATALGMKAIPNIDITMLTTPTLVLVGENDQLVPSDYSKQFYQSLPHHQFQTIREAAHMAMLEQRKEVNAAIAKFLDIAVIPA